MSQPATAASKRRKLRPDSVSERARGRDDETSEQARAGRACAVVGSRADDSFPVTEITRARVRLGWPLAAGMTAGWLRMDVFVPYGGLRSTASPATSILSRA